MDDKKEVINLIINSCQKSSWISDAMKLSVGPIISALLAIGVFYAQYLWKKWLDERKINRNFKNELQYEKKALEAEIVKIENNFQSLYRFANSKLRGGDRGLNINGFKSHSFLSLKENYYEIYTIISDEKKEWVKIISQVYESLNDLSDEFLKRLNIEWSKYESLKTIPYDLILKEMGEQRRYMELCAIAINSINMLLSERAVEEVSYDPKVTNSIYEKEFEKININYNDLREKEGYIQIGISGQQ